MLGYTQWELEHYFESYIDDLLEKMEQDKSKILSDIKLWYNGYSWDGKNFVYNPFSILNLFVESTFGNYWFATGTPTFLTTLVRKNNIPPEDLDKTQVMEYTFDKFELRNMDVISLLFQTGYLTIKEIDREDRIFTLSYPNNEVKNSFLYSLISDLTAENLSEPGSLIIKLKKNLQSKDIESFFQHLKSLFASIPYNIFLNKEEAYYHSVIYLVLSLLGINIDCEIETNIGRIDAVIQLDDTIYVMEFKLESGEEALEQIKKQRYHEKYLNSGKAIILLGVGFGVEEKNINDWKMDVIVSS
jgi:hypothetical protein